MRLFNIYTKVTLLSQNQMNQAKGFIKSHYKIKLQQNIGLHGIIYYRIPHRTAFEIWLPNNSNILRG